MPAAGDDRAVRRGRGAPAERAADGGAPPCVLPRLLPAGLRRVDPAGQRRARPPAQRRSAAGGRAAGGGHPRQGARGVRAHGVVRRHHRAGHPRRREPVRRALLHGAAGAARQRGAGVQQRRVHAAAADVDRGRAAVGVRQQEPVGPGGPGGAVGRAHGGEGAVQLVRRRGGAGHRRHHPVRDGHVLRGRRRRHAAGSGLPDAGGVRQPLLHRADAEEEQGGDAAVGPGPGHGPAHQLARPGLRRQPLVVLRPVRDLHGQDEPAQGTAGERRRDPPELLTPKHQQRCRYRRRHCLSAPTDLGSIHRQCQCH